jgi:hypothetical protein
MEVKEKEKRKAGKKSGFIVKSIERSLNTTAFGRFLQVTVHVD